MHRVAVLCSILGAAGASALHAQRPDDTISNPAYAQPQRMVDVGGGRRLNLYCVGPADSGWPTVVFESGTSYPNAVWGYVQREVARRVQACSYDPRMKTRWSVSRPLPGMLRSSRRPN